MSPKRSRRSRSTLRRKSRPRPKPTRSFAASEVTPPPPSPGKVLNLGPLVTLAGLALVVYGQILVFKHVPAPGILWTLFGLACLIVPQMKPLEVRLPGGAPPPVPYVPPSTPVRSLAAGRPEPIPPPVPASAPAIALPSLGTLIRLALFAAAVYYGMKGQSLLLMQQDGATLAPGLKYFFISGALLIAAFLGRPGGVLREEKIPFKVEVGLFLGIFALALFFRLWRLSEFPAGIFFDEGHAGLGALRILHEGWRPFNITETHEHPSLYYYALAAWFAILKPTTLNFALFSVFMGTMALPFAYWFYRQLMGPRAALVGLFVLSVMRWNINFTRNSQPSELLPFPMMATAAFLLYGFTKRKTWAFFVSALFFGAGLYTYQSYKIFPALMVLYLVYEIFARPKDVWANKWRILLFAVTFLVIASPLLNLMRELGGVGTREASISIMAECKRQGSIKPFLTNLSWTALMFNRRGDPNPRHNLQDHRMLDDVTGILFVLGVIWALSRFWRREHFYALTGLALMSLPCLLSTDACHANRMMGVTPYVALLAVFPVMAAWDWLGSLSKRWGDRIMVVLLILPLLFMARQNYDTYFNVQAKNFASWMEFSTPETALGKQIAFHKDRYEYFISPRYWDHFSLRFVGYSQKEHIHELVQPSMHLPLGLVPPGRGVLFGLEEGRTGVADALKRLYPGAVAEDLPAVNGQPMAHVVRVEPEAWDAVKGLTFKPSGSEKGQQVAGFPAQLPPGPFEGVFEGSLWVETAGDHRFKASGNVQVEWTISGMPVLGGRTVRLARGWYPVRLTASAGRDARLSLSTEVEGRDAIPLMSTVFSTLRPSNGLRGEYANASNLDFTNPRLIQWDPVINFTNGNDIPLRGQPLAIRWRGVLNAPVSGKYVFFAQTADQARVVIDGETVVKRGPQGTGTVTLSAGAHDIRVDYLKAEGWWAYFSLKWKRPDRNAVEVVPESAFGVPRPD